MTHIRSLFGLLTVLTFCAVALAAPPEITSHTPGQNALDVPELAPVIIIFDSEINPATISDATIIVSGNYSGRLLGSLVFDDPSSTVTFTPSEAYMPGELITVTATSSIESSAGESFAGYAFMFTVTVAEGWEGITYRSSYPEGYGMSFINVADLNEDRDLDIATGFFFESSRLFTNNGTGEFAQSYLPVSGWTTQLSDMNYNGFMDVIYSYPIYEKTTSLRGEVALKYCNALGEYDYNVRLQYPATFNSVTADFDKDGLMDVFVFGLVESPTFWFGNGDSTYTAYLPETVTHHWGVVADIDNDGFMDVVFNDTQVLHNNGDRTFVMISLTGLPGANLEYTHVADLNGDGYLDILWAFDNSGIIQPFINNGTGEFAPGFEYEVQGEPQFLTTGDMDGDGDLDVIVSSTLAVDESMRYYLTVFLNYGNGILADSFEYELAHNDARTLVTGDLDSDGRLDIAAYNSIDERLSIFWNSDAVEVCGDINNDGSLNIGDVVFLVSHIFQFAPGPEPWERGDVNCDYNLNIGDAVYLLSHIFLGGPPPCCY